MEHCTECAKLRAEAANSAAQRDEAVLRAKVAEERLRAVQADASLALAKAKFAEGQRKSAMDLWADTAAKLEAAEAELARIRAADRQHTAARLQAAQDMKERRG